LELGETLRDALVREVHEETGLRVAIGGLIDVVDAVTRNPAGEVIRHYVLVDFVTSPVGGELCAGSDAAEARWVPFSDLTEYSLWSETRRVIEAALRMRG
jgi:8-oxo-dGTP diphosphatase